MLTLKHNTLWTRLILSVYVIIISEIKCSACLSNDNIFLRSIIMKHNYYLRSFLQDTREYLLRVIILLLFFLTWKKWYVYVVIYVVMFAIPKNFIILSFILFFNTNITFEFRWIKITRSTDVIYIKTENYIVLLCLRTFTHHNLAISVGRWALAWHSSLTLYFRMYEPVNFARSLLRTKTTLGKVRWYFKEQLL